MRDYPAKRARLGMGRSRAPSPQPFTARCTSCGWEGQAYNSTCPECSSRIQAVRV